jgi:hypothetical protein
MIQRVLTAAADERNQSNPKQAAIVPPELELVLTAKSIDIEISPILRADNFQFWRRTRLADLMGLQ